MTASLVWFDFFDLSTFQSKFQVSKLGDDYEEISITSSDVTSIGLLNNRLKVDYFDPTREGVFTLDFNLEKDEIEGGEFQRNRELTANLYGHHFRSKSEILVLGTYRPIGIPSPNFSFLLRIKE